MIEIFNLGLNSRNELQTKHPFGENCMDYIILLLVHRDPGQSLSCFISSRRWCLMPLCSFPAHLEECMMTVIRRFHLSHLLSCRFLFSGAIGRRDALCCIVIPAARYNRLYAFQNIDPDAAAEHIMSCLCLFLCECTNDLIYIQLHLNCSMFFSFFRINAHRHLTE